MIPIILSFLTGVGVGITLIIVIAAVSIDEEDREI